MTSRHRDVLVAALLAAAAASACYLAVTRLDAAFFDPARGGDVWFEGDVPRIFDEMTHRYAAHSRATVHPLFSLFATPSVYALRALGLPPLHAVAVFVAGAAAAWTASLYALLRVTRQPRGVAVLFTAIGGTSAAGLFWLTVPETYASGSATMLCAIGLAGWAEHRPVCERWFVAASALTLSITVTNWVAGIAAAAAGRPWRRSLQITINAFALVALLWAVQRAIVPRADFFIGYSNEQRYLRRPEAGGPRWILPAFFVNAIVMPRIGAIVKPGRGAVMTVQRSGVGTGSTWGRIAAVLWILLLGLGVWGWMRRLRQSPAALVLGAVLGAQVVLHLLYGTETFLYSLNFAPLLVVMASFSTTTPARRLAVVLASALLLCALVNNGRQWLAARAFFDARQRIEAVTR